MVPACSYMRFFVTVPGLPVYLYRGSKGELTVPGFQTYRNNVSLVNLPLELADYASVVGKV